MTTQGSVADERSSADPRLLRSEFLPAPSAGGLALLVPGVATAQPARAARAGAAPTANIIVRWNEAREGTPVGFLRSIFVPEGETCFSLYEAETAEIACEVARRAELRFDRVAEAAPIQPFAEREDKT